MKAKVYFMDLRASHQENLFEKLARLLETAGIANIFKERDLVAVKLHFGEMGNAAFIRPIFLRKIVERIKHHGGKPFLTDANTLYVGARGDAVNHLTTAIHHGFDYAVVEAPLVIADGLRGKTETAVSIHGKNFKEVFIGSEIVQADALISVAHFKGHELSGFGGAIKNLGMGCASRRGKMAQHSTVSPQVNEEKCVGCEECVDHCSQHALSVTDGKASIDSDQCIGCGECVLICSNSAIEIQWNQDIPAFLQNMAEYTAGVLKNKANKLLNINFINNISPACDCFEYNDAVIVRDIGVAASTDPVAIDQASVDLINAEQALPGSCLESNINPGEDKFKGIYPNIDWPIQLEHAEKMGLGSRDYELIKI